MKHLRVSATVALGLLLILVGLGALGAPQKATAATDDPASGQAGAAEHRVCPGGCAFSSVQAAVDAAAEGDVIKVAAGTYTDVHARANVTQVVYIDKELTLRGGYTTTNWATSDPAANPTTLDARGQGRVMVIFIDDKSANPVVEGFRLTGGVTPGPQIVGGGLQIIISNATIRNNVIVSNTADYDGGGVSVYDSSATFEGNTLANNRALISDGGGAYLAYGKTRWINNHIVSNTAESGGGIYTIMGSDVFTGNVIAENSALDGGGVAIYDSHLAFDNNVVMDNEATRRGAGIYASSGGQGFTTTVRLRHTTITRNTGGGSGDGSGIHVDQNVYGDYATVRLTNTLFAANAIGITVTEGNTATLSATLWHANATDRGGDGTLVHTGDVTGDPAFKPDGYHIDHASAARNRGVDAGVTVDMDGQPRPATDGFDLGADEYLPTIFMPMVLRGL